LIEHKPESSAAVVGWNATSALNNNSKYKLLMPRND